MNMTLPAPMLTILGMAHLGSLMLEGQGMDGNGNEDDEAIDQAGPEAGQSGGDDAGLDDADDDRADNRAVQRALAAENGRAADEDRREDQQHVAFALGRPPIGHFQANEHGDKGRERSHEDEKAKARPVGPNSHHARRLEIVAHKEQGVAENVAVEHKPQQHGQPQAPQGLGRDFPEKPTHEQVMQARAPDVGQVHGQAVGGDDGRSAPEKLRSNGGDDGGNADAHHQNAVERSGERPRDQSRRQPQPGTGRRPEHLSESQTADGHDRGKRQVHLARDHAKRQPQGQQGGKRDRGEERKIDARPKKRPRGQRHERPQKKTQQNGHADLRREGA